MKKIEIKAFGSYAPPFVVTNDDLSKFVETSDEWIYSRTGIKRRHITTDENTSDMCIKVANKVLKNSGFNPENIDIIVVCTLTGEYGSPSTACIVQGAIGAKNAIAFDLVAACTGFVYGLSVAEKLIRCGNYNSALVIGGENLSKIVDWTERKNCVLLGDGCGGALIVAGEKESFLCEDIHADGSKAQMLLANHQPLRSPFATINEPIQTFTMDGRGIFDFVVKKIPISIKTILEKTNTSIDDIKYIIPHQANARIIEAVAKKMKIGLEKFYMNIEEYGNTSSGTIPIALDEMAEKGLITIGSGEKIILAGFGGGLTWGALLLEI